MFIAEIQNRNTQASKGFLIEEEYRGKFGFGLTPFQYEAYRFKSERQAIAAGQDLIGDNASSLVVVREVM